MKLDGSSFQRCSWNYAGSFAATWRMQGKAGLLGPFERERGKRARLLVGLFACASCFAVFAVMGTNIPEILQAIS